MSELPPPPPIAPRSEMTDLIQELRVAIPGGLVSLVAPANRLAIAGTLLLAVAMAAVVFLVTDVVNQQLIAAIAAAVLAGLVGWFWFTVPFARHLRVTGGTG